MLTFSLHAQAPVSLRGSALFQTITSGDGLKFDQSGYTVVFVANTANNYSRVDLIGNLGTSGAFTYGVSAADSLLTVNDNQAGSFSADYTFNDPASGSFAFNQSSTGGFQDGSFSYYSGQAPASLAGKTMYLSVINGGGGNQSSGTATLLFTAGTVTHISDLDGTSNTVNYVYSSVNRSTGKVQITSGSAGSSYFSFSDPSNGAYALTKPNGSWELGVFTIPDTTPPTVTITSPGPNQTWSNDLFTVTGKASDDVGVSQVTVSSDGLTWIDTTTTNKWTNWISLTDVTLTPGTNTIYAVALDTNGNFKTNTAKVIYILSAPLTVSTNGGNGTINPALNGALLQIGKNYTLTATPALGFAFTNWTDGSNSIITNKPTLSFLMASNLSLTANFVDITRPTVSITNIPVSGNVSNELFALKGKAGDNVAVTNVSYNLNNNGWSWASSTNGFTNWFTTDLDLTPGTNLISIYALDSTGNASLTNTVKVVYILSAQLTVSTNGKGSIAPAYNNALLQIGKNFTMTATPAVGFAFTNWTDVSSFIITNKPALTFLMASNLSFTANFIDIARPTLSVTNIPTNGNLSNALFTVKGRAGDNLAVSNVLYNLNNNGWLGVDSTNNFSNWSVGLTLTPGTNSLGTYAVDTSGNCSLTNTVRLIYILSAQLTVSTNGKGTIAPAYNKALLQIGKNYTMTATPAVGFVFTNWTDGSSPIVTNKPALTFMMASNLSFTANFIDIAKPVLTVTTPTAATTAGNELYLATGNASDNAAATNVYYNLNSMGWTPVDPTNNYSNWRVTLDLTPGTNYFSAYAVDSSGNVSATNSIKFLYSTAPMTLSGLAAVVTPDDSGTAPFGVAFGATTFSQASMDMTNGNNGVGNYTYTRQTPSSSQLKFTYLAPPSTTNGGQQTINLSFTQPNIARFTNVASGNAGGMVFTSTPTLIPATLLNQTFTAVNTFGDGQSINFLVGKTVVTSLKSGTTKTNLGGTYVTYGPVGALLKKSNTNGQDYTIITFLGTNYGTAYSESYDPAGTFTDANLSVFGVKSQKLGGNAPTNLVNRSAFVFNVGDASKFIFSDLANFVWVSPTDNSITNGVGNYVYTRTDTNSATLDVNLTTPVASPYSVSFLFVAPNFAIFTNLDSTFGAAAFK